MLIMQSVEEKITICSLDIIQDIPLFPSHKDILVEPQNNSIGM